MSLKNINFYFVSLTGSVIFTYYYFLYTHEYPPGSSERIANFEADKMFQTRMLVVSIANFAEPSLPFISDLLQWLIPYPVNYEVILQIINVIFTFLLVILFPTLLSCFGFRGSKLISLIVFVPLSWNYIFINGLIDGAGLYYSFDIPSLTFFTVGLILFLKRKWLFFYPIFILACLNRESAAFISLAGGMITSNFTSIKFAVFCKNNPKILLHVISQATIWILLRIILSYLVKDNPGILFEKPQSMISFLNCIWTGSPHWAMQNPIWYFTLFAGIWVIPLLLYKYLDFQTRRLAIVGLIYVTLLCFRSNMMEIRVYNELNVIILVCMILSIKSKFQNKIV